MKVQSQFIEMFFKNTWKEQYLEDVVSEDCSLSYGIVQPGEGVEDGIPVVRPVDLVSDIVEPDCLKKTTIDIANSYKRTTLKGGELLLCVRGTTGLLSMASNRLNGGNVTRGIVPIWFKKDVSKAFMFHQMKSDYVQTQIKENTYGTTLLQINIKDLRKIKVILPPEDLQLKFVSVAEQADKSEFDSLRSEYELKLSFPEGDNIPQVWVSMIAGGDQNLAKQYLNDYVHKLGNLTITGYNSTLSNNSFENKRDRQDKKTHRYIGYRNGLDINKEIAQKETWTIDDITNRTDELVKELLKMYKFPE